MTKLLRFLSAGITSASLSLLIVSYGPAVRESLPKVPVPLVEATGPKNRFPTELYADRKQEIVEEASGLGVNAEFSIVVPSLDIAENIVANVDPSDKDDYLPAILKGVGHAKGTSVPSQNGVTYLFAHSTNSPLFFEKLNAVFFNLQEIEAGAEIYVYYDYRKYKFVVNEKNVVEISDTYWIGNPENEGKKLVLQTSHPPGTVWKRLLVIASPSR